MIVPQQLTEGTQPGNLTFGVPAPQSVVVDNYSQSYLYIPGAGVYIGPRSTRIVAIPPGQATIGVVWQTPPGLIPPPVGNPRGSATLVWSDAVVQTSQAIPLYAAQTAPVELAQIQPAQVPLGTIVAIPSGVLSLVLFTQNNYRSSFSLSVLGNVTGNEYATQTVGVVNGQQITTIVIPAIDPTDPAVLIIGENLAGGAYSLVTVNGYPTSVPPSIIYQGNPPWTISGASGASFPPSPAASVMNNNGVIISGSTTAISTSLVGSFLIGITAGTVRYLRFVKFQLASPSSTAGEDLFLLGHTSGKQITPIRLVANALAASVDEARILDPPWDLVSLFPGDSQVDVYVYLSIAGTAAAYQAEATP